MPAPAALLTPLFPIDDTYRLPAAMLTLPVKELLVLERIKLPLPFLLMPLEPAKALEMVRLALAVAPKLNTMLTGVVFVAASVMVPPPIVKLPAGE